ncbi:histidine kinase-, DNA gyrase B-, and HSP90-like ATPase family protein [Asticcacaulis biprosthecium C19]|uniref:histidine kinase n=1 Tax=Asticcacaulis biprosthecium C19 TaxID=715226 RepID=F4QNY2_9CAUL|nr:HAMP domain-containing sensor histidine kinase [Asticcacaulis biprosthecium]EGF91040.1 histidine kinase-, DNA gyrase B-, and HSP90-like ATPase family protein [Asticcacaulis biprosthecium C19]
MRLVEFIRQNRDPIIAEWESFATTLSPAANMTRMQLRDHIDEILSFICDDLETAQTKTEQVEKSHGKRDSGQGYADTAAEAHGELRHGDGFDIVQMVSEYRALRGSIVKLWMRRRRTLEDTDIEDLTRFNESIDQALAESVVKFSAKVDYSRDLILGVLGHDLRSPLGAISMAGQLLPRLGALTDKQATLAAQVGTCSDRMTRIITDLLDLARARHGTRLPVSALAMDLGQLAQQMVAETKSQHADRDIDLTIKGDVTGAWDNTRLSQVLSNLLGNAIQYGDATAPVTVTILGTADDVSLTVLNQGPIIPEAQMASLFHSFTRGAEPGAQRNGGSNLGLGLFITREIVKSHDGKIEVSSNKRDGTSFRITLPRRRTAAAD